MVSLGLTVVNGSGGINQNSLDQPWTTDEAYPDRGTPLLIGSES